MEEDRMLSDEILLGIINAKSGGGGGGGTDDYNDLKNQPKIEGVTLKGNKTAADLGLATAAALADKVDKVQGKSLSTNDFTDAYKTAIGDNTTALALKQNATDNNLDTEDKTIVGAINENAGDIGSLKSGLTNVESKIDDATEYPYADVITIDDAVPSNLADCSVKIEPVQDLHGYSAPWVGGAGKNKLPLVLADIKAVNTDGTWNGNTYTHNDVAWTILTDDADNVTGVRANGTASNISYLGIYTITVPAGSYASLVSDTDVNVTLQTRLNDAGGSDVGLTTKTTKTATFSESTTIFNRLRVASGDTVSNATVYPMLASQSEPLSVADWQPYTNICPISGHTEVDVQRDGVNHFQSGNSETVSGIVYAKNADGSFTVSGTRNGAMSKNLGYANVKSAMGVVNVSALGTSQNIQLYNIILKDTSENELASFSAFGNVNLASYPTVAKIEINVKGTSNGAVASGTLYPMVVIGEETIPFEPYHGKTYTIALGSTIYGGTVDFDSGVMTVTHKYVDLGDFTYQTSSVFKQAYISDVKRPASNNVPIDAICEQYRFVARYSAENDGDACVDTDGYLKVRTTDTPDGGFCYELATPTTIQLTPQQIQLLKGTNTITASTGQISVTVNGVSGSIGSVQEQVNELAEIKPLNYSTTEQKTGQKWIDGKDIYFRVNNTPISIIANDSWYNSGFTGIDTVIDYIVSMTRDSENIGSTFNNGHVDYVNRNNEVLIKGTNFTLTDNYVVVKQILYYTKTT